MAAKATYDVIMRDLKARNFAPVYFLMGDEPYFIDKIDEYIAQNALAEEERDFNQFTFYGADTDLLAVLDQCRQFPMMGEKQVIIIREAHVMRDLSLLEPYLAAPAPTTILVLCFKKPMGDHRKLVAAAEKNGVVLDSRKKRDQDLPPFIVGYLKTKGVTIDNNACQILADHIGTDLSRLCSEMDKLLVAAAESDKRVTAEMVEKNVGISKDFNVFEFKNAIIRKDVYKANVIGNYFDKNPKAGGLFALMPLLYSYFQNLFIAYYCPNKNNEKELASFIGLSSAWGVHDYVIGLKNFSARKVMEILDKIKETDAKLKGLDNGNSSQTDLMQDLIYFILH